MDNEKLKQFIDKICTCRKGFINHDNPFLQSDAHYMNCPTWDIQGVTEKNFSPYSCSFLPKRVGINH